MMVLGEILDMRILGIGVGLVGRRVVLKGFFVKFVCQVRDLSLVFCFLDVMDVVWFFYDVWLVSCSVDNIVVIWNVVKFLGLGFF